MAKDKKKKEVIFGPWFLTAWREHNKLTVDELGDLINMTGASISRMENRKQPYSQPVLESLAKVLKCQPEDLISRPPGYVDRLRAMMAGMDPEEQKRALAVVQALKDNKSA